MNESIVILVGARRTCSSSAQGGAAQAAAGQAARRAAPEPGGYGGGSIGGPRAHGPRVQPLRPGGGAGSDGQAVPRMAACMLYTVPANVCLCESSQCTIILNLRVYR